MPSQPSPSKQPTNPNLIRSLRYYQKGVLNPEAWFGIVESDYTKIIDAVDWEALFPKERPDHTLLDIGCGTGRFPKMLRTKLAPAIPIHYDYLDPAQYCLTTCQQVLQPPFFPRHAWQTTWEHAEEVIIPGTYDIAWAIQSFYCLEQQTLYPSLDRLLRALHPSRGTTCIVLAKCEAFFPQVHRIFFQHCSQHTSPPYLTAESVVTCLEELGSKTVIREIDCIHTISIREDRLLEQYLQQSVMDTTPLPQWKKNTHLHKFLESYRHGDFYHFPNSYWLILSVPGSAGNEGRHRLQRYLKPVTSTQLSS